MGQKRIHLLVAALALCAAIHSSFAGNPNAIVSWQGSITISGDSNVSTTGSLVAAFNMNGPAATVNGVNFAAFAVTSGTTFATNGNFVFTESPGHIIAESALGSGQTPFSNLSANYQTLLSSAIATDENNTLALFMNGLVAGQQYQFQFWTNDSAFATAGHHATTALAGNSVTLDDNTADAAGGVGQEAVGIFTALGPDQSISFSGINSSNSPTVNAFQIRAIPEPSSLALLTAAAVIATFRCLIRKPKKERE